MTNSWRRTALAARHIALGSKLEDWNGMETAWTYETSIESSYETIRTAAGLMDVSGLKKVHCVGPHAEKLIDYATTRDVSKLYPGKSVYASMLDDNGKFVDDCIIYRTGPNAFMVVHGAGRGYEMLTSAAKGLQVEILFDDDLHDISLQGPKAVEFLEQYIPAVRQLPYFHHMQTQLFGYPVMISRTGYTGERGYEIFCKASDVTAIWDTILEDGADMGIKPCCFSALDMLRVESSLLFFPDDNSEMYPFENEPAGDTLWELGLDFTVSKEKTEFRGAIEHFRSKGKERFKIFGVQLDSKEAASAGDTLWADGKEVGVITCAMYSPLTDKSIAIARFSVPYAEQGAKLEVKGSLSVSAIAHSLPFDDPEKKKRTVKD